MDWHFSKLKKKEVRSLKLTTDCELPCLVMYAVAVQSLVLTSTSAPYQGEEVSENQEHCLKLEEFYVGSQTPPPPTDRYWGGPPISGRGPAPRGEP